MITITTNINEQIKKAIHDKVVQINPEKIAREAALDVVALISDRVQQRGEKTNGEKITTSSNKTTGAYSKYYGIKRKKSGRETDYIDLTFSGDMMGDFITAPIDGGAEVGFKGKLSSDKAEWNEARFGELFSLSDSEQELIGKVVTNRINGILNK